MVLQNGTDVKSKKQQCLFLLRVNSSHFYGINIFLFQSMRKYIKLVTLKHVKATNYGTQETRQSCVMNDNVFIIFSSTQIEKVEVEASQLGVRGSSLSSGH